MFLKKWMLVSLMNVIILSGCQAGNDETAYDLRNDRTNPNYMANRSDNEPANLDYMNNWRNGGWGAQDGDGDDANGTGRVRNHAMMQTGRNRDNNIILQNRAGDDGVTRTRTNRQYQVENDITNRNPNFLDLRGTSNKGQGINTNRGSDIDRAREIVNGTDEFRVESVWVNNNGDRMTVNVDERERLTNRERNQAIGRLKERLTQALPRYTIDIR
jgi:hypothetical protein